MLSPFYSAISDEHSPSHLLAIEVYWALGTVVHESRNGIWWGPSYWAVRRLASTSEGGFHFKRNSCKNEIDLSMGTEC